MGGYDSTTEAKITPDSIYTGMKKTEDDYAGIDLGRQRLINWIDEHAVSNPSPSQQMGSSSYD